jgi:hypothetical protein
VNGHPADVVAHDLDLARVHPAAHLDPRVADRLLDRRSAAKSGDRTAEGGEESVAGGVDLGAAEPEQLGADEPVVIGQDLPPGSVDDGEEVESAP